MKYNFVKANKATFLIIENDTGMEVTLSTYGASLYEVRLYGEIITLSPNSLDDFYLSDNPHGKVVGPNIKDSHLSNRNWGYSFERAKSGIAIRFYTKDGKGFFKDKFKYEVIFRIPKDRNDLIIQYKASSKEDTAILLSSKTYFNIATEVAVNASNVASKPFSEMPCEFVETNEETSYKQPKKFSNYNRPYLLDNSNYESTSLITKNKKYIIECYTTFDSVVLSKENNRTSLIDQETFDISENLGIMFLNTNLSENSKNKCLDFKVKYSFKINEKA